MKAPDGPSKPHPVPLDERCPDCGGIRTYATVGDERTRILGYSVHGLLPGHRACEGCVYWLMFSMHLDRDFLRELGR